VPILLAIFIIFIFDKIYFLDNGKHLVKIPQKESRNNPTPTLISRGVDFPLQPDHPSVANATIFYTITGTVKEIGNGKLQLASSDLPTFSFTESTPVFSKTSLTAPSVEAEISDIAVGTMLIVTARYDFTQKSWAVERLTINQVAPSE
jgi:hypothetical protein